MFDPESVERIEWHDVFPSTYVLASDYDKLLELYREAKEKIRLFEEDNIAFHKIARDNKYDRLDLDEIIASERAKETLNGPI